MAHRNGFINEKIPSRSGSICRNALRLIHKPSFKKRNTNKRIKLTLKKSSSKWHRRKTKTNQEEQDEDLQILSAPKSIRCPLTLSIMNSPIRSTVCNHVFERDAIIKYLEQKSYECAICTFENADNTKLCTVCGGTLTQNVQCPVPGCIKIISTHCLQCDLEVAQLVENRKKTKEKQKNEEGEGTRIGDEIVVLNKDYVEKCQSNTKNTEDVIILNEDFDEKCKANANKKHDEDDKDIAILNDDYFEMVEQNAKRNERDSDSDDIEII